MVPIFKSRHDIQHNDTQHWINTKIRKLRSKKFYSTVANVIKLFTGVSYNCS